jgi:hypothetical protein
VPVARRSCSATIVVTGLPPQYKALTIVVAYKRVVQRAPGTEFGDI